jgi:hypothetical protein
MLIGSQLSNGIAWSRLGCTGNQTHSASSRRKHSRTNRKLGVLSTSQGFPLDLSVFVLISGPDNEPSDYMRVLGLYLHLPYTRIYCQGITTLSRHSVSDIFILPLTCMTTEIMRLLYRILKPFKHNGLPFLMNTDVWLWRCD